MADPRSEPSMEDILASIKRIIADDQALPLDRPATLPAPSTRPELPKAPAWPERGADRAPAWPSRTEPPQPPESILELTNLAPQDMQPPRVPPASRAPVEPAPPPPEPSSDFRQRGSDRERYRDYNWSAPEEDEIAPPPPRAAAPSPPAPEPAPRPVARDLGQTIVNRAASGDNTLEGLVREMLRPMLSDWIDAHAPAMVERIVQEEIRKMMDREADGQ